MKTDLFVTPSEKHTPVDAQSLDILQGPSATKVAGMYLRAGSLTVKGLQDDLSAMNGLRSAEAELRRAKSTRDVAEAEKRVGFYLDRVEARDISEAVKKLDKAGRKDLDWKASEILNGFLHVSNDATRQRVMDVLEEVSRYVDLPPYIQVATSGWNLNTYSLREHGGMKTLLERMEANLYDGHWSAGHKSPSFREDDAPDPRIEKWK